MNDDTQINQNDDDKISSLYKQGSVETPASHINEKILHRARQGSGNVLKFPLKSIFNAITSSRSLAVAAVLVIGISIILQMQFDHPEEMMSPKTEEYSGNGFLLDRLSSDSHEIMQDESLSTPAASSAVEVEPLIHQQQPTKIKEPAKKVFKPAMKKKSSSAKPGISYDFQRSERRRKMQLEKQRVLEKRAEEKQARSKRRLAERQMKTMSPEPQTVLSMPGKPVNCDSLSNAECLASRNCFLNYTNDILVCQKPADHCQRDFSQANDTINQCHQKGQCEYTEGQCKCDSDGICECVDNTLPSCLAEDLFSEEDD